MSEDFKRFVKHLAAESGKVIAPYFGDPGVAVERKGDDSPVTIADRKAEETLRALIQREFPDHGIVGEEFGAENDSAEYVWILDPIDGTISFTTGCPLFGTLIGLLHRGRPILGAIHQPILKQLCLGDNESTTLNDRPVKARRVADLSEATLLTSCVAAIPDHQPANAANFDRLARRARVFRTWGDCYGYLLLSAGFADVMVDAIVNPWDILPVIPVVRGAGAIVTSWNGGDPTTADSAIAAAPNLHAEVVRLLNEGPNSG